MADKGTLAGLRQAMDRDPDDASARLAYYRAFADSDLCLLLDREPEGELFTPRLFDLQDGPVVLVFDSDEALAAFAGAPVPYLALPGRVIAGKLAGRSTGIGVNLADDSAFLMPPDAVDWLVASLAAAPERAGSPPVGWSAPAEPGRAQLLSAGLAGLGDLAPRAWLADATFADGRRATVLVVEGADPAAKPALAKALAEALMFLGPAADGVDLAFLSPGEAADLNLAAFAAPVALTRAERPAPAPRAAPRPPGSDPDRPPRLR